MNQITSNTYEKISQEHENMLKNLLELCRKGKSLVREMIQKKEFKNPESLQVNH